MAPLQSAFWGTGGQAKARALTRHKAASSSARQASPALNTLRAAVPPLA
jgi:hypothetical protein